MLTRPIGSETLKKWRQIKVCVEHVNVVPLNLSQPRGQKGTWRKLNQPDWEIRMPLETGPVHWNEKVKWWNNQLHDVAEWDHCDETLGHIVLKIWWFWEGGGVKVREYDRCGKPGAWVDGAEHWVWTGSLLYQIKDYPGWIEGPNYQVSTEGWMLKSLKDCGLRQDLVRVIAIFTRRSRSSFWEPDTESLCLSFKP